MKPFQKQKQSQINQATIVLQDLYIRCILTNPHIFINKNFKERISPFKILFVFYMYGLCMGCFAVWACSAQGSLKRAPDAVELELQMFSICNCTMWVPGPKPGSPGRRASAFKC